MDTMDSLSLLGPVYPIGAEEASPYLVSVTFPLLLLSQVLADPRSTPILVPGVRELPRLHRAGALFPATKMTQSFVPVPPEVIRSLGSPVDARFRVPPFPIRNRAIQYMVSFEDVEGWCPKLTLHQLARTALRSQSLDPWAIVIALTRGDPQFAFRVLGEWAERQGADRLPALSNLAAQHLLCHGEVRFREWAIRNVRHLRDGSCPCR